MDTDARDASRGVPSVILKSPASGELTASGLRSDPEHSCGPQHPHKPCVRAASPSGRRSRSPVSARCDPCVPVSKIVMTSRGRSPSLLITENAGSADAGLFFTETLGTPRFDCVPSVSVKEIRARATWSSLGRGAHPCISVTSVEIVLPCSVPPCQPAESK